MVIPTCGGVVVVVEFIPPGSFDLNTLDLETLAISYGRWFSGFCRETEPIGMDVDIDINTDHTNRVFIYLCGR